MPFTVKCALAASLIAASALAAEPTSAPTLTKAGIRTGKDTTYVHGPVLEDGTIDYISAYNAVAGKGATQENNAAIILVPLVEKNLFLGGDKARPAKAREMLGLPPARPGDPTLQSVSDFLGPGPAAVGAPWKESDQFSTTISDIRKRLIPAEEAPAVTRWVNAQEVLLERVIAASQRPCYFVPAVRDGPSPRLVGAMPSGMAISYACQPLEVRANFRAAKGDFVGARRDIAAVLRLGRLLWNGHADLDSMLGSYIAARTLEQIRAWAASGKLTAAQARDLIAEIDALPPRREDDAISGRFVWLDMVMEIRRGHGQELMQLLCMRFDKQPLDLGDLADADINGLLTHANNVYDMWVEVDRLPNYRAQRYAREQRAAALQGRNTPVLPAYAMFSTAFQGSATSKPDPVAAAAAQEAAVIAYLKRRPGETRAAFTTRIGRLLFEQADPGFNAVLENRIAWTTLTRLALALAAYHAEQGEYPATLAALAPKYLAQVPMDHFSGEQPVYRREGKGYLLYSIGANLKDEGGKDKSAGGDDLVVKVP